MIKKNIYTQLIKFKILHYLIFILFIASSHSKILLADEYGIEKVFDEIEISNLKVTSYGNKQFHDLTKKIEEERDKEKVEKVILPLLFEQLNKDHAEVKLASLLLLSLKLFHSDVLELPPSANKLLLQNLSDKNMRVRIATARTISFIKPKPATEFKDHLLNIINDIDENNQVKSYTLSALNNYEKFPNDFADILISIIKNDSKPQDKIYSLSILSKISKTKQIGTEPFLLALKDKTSRVRGFAITAILNSVYTETSKQAYMKGISELVKNEDENITYRKRGIKALYELGQNGIITKDTYIDIIKNSKDENLRIYTAKQVENIDPPDIKYLLAIKELLKDPELSENSRKRAEMAYSRIYIKLCLMYSILIIHTLLKILIKGLTTAHSIYNLP